MLSWLLGSASLVAYAAASIERVDCTSTAQLTTVSFEHATLSHSNLGGLGPDYSAPPTILFAGVGQTPEGRLDIEVSNLTAYDHASTWRPHVENVLVTSFNGTFGQVGLQVNG